MHRESSQGFATFQLLARRSTSLAIRRRPSLTIKRLIFLLNLLFFQFLIQFLNFVWHLLQTSLLDVYGRQFQFQMDMLLESRLLKILEENVKLQNKLENMK